LCKIRCGNHDPSSLQTVRSFANITGVLRPNTTVLKKILSIWNFSAISNEQRSMLFFEQNNTLPTNARLHSFNNNMNPKCTFCRIIDREGAERESFNHLFYTCPVTKNLIGRIISDCNDVPAYDSNDFKKMYWYGIFINDEENVDAYLIFFSLFRTLLYRYKLRRKIPNPDCFKREFMFALSCIMVNRSLNRKYRTLPMFSRIQQALG